MLRATVGLLIVALAAPALAEVVTDGTTGPRVSLSGDFEIGADLGRRAGRNLFHSFERFSLATGERATFSGPDEVRNIISRVTGGARSEIDGTIASTIPGADFYFVNPAGVVFGPNASLDLQGSFYVSTADELRFADGARFSGSDPATSSFTVAAPAAFGFLGAAAGRITIAGSQLALLTPGQTVSLSGGELTVENGSTIIANNVALAAQATAGSVPLTSERAAVARSGIIALGSDRPGVPAQVASAGLLDGTLRIEAGELRLANAIAGDVHLGPVDSAGGVEIAADRVRIQSEHGAPGSAVGILTFSQGTGRAGDVHVEASEVTVVGGIVGSVPTAADGGRVEIEADRILIAGSASSTGGIGVLAGAFGSGASGGTAITAHESLTIGAGGQINSASLGDRPAGPITIDLRGGAPLIMRPGALIEATARGQGDGGSIRITGGDVLITGAVVSAETFAAGGGGTIAIETGRLVVNHGFVGANAREGATGSAGPVLVDANRVEIMNEGRIFNGTNSTGNGGNLSITTGTLVVDGALDHAARFNTGISAAAQPGSGGRSGDVTVTASRQIVLRNRGEIASGTQGQGGAGDITVTGPSIVLQDGGRIDSSAFHDLAAASALGNAGNITIAADRLEIDRGAITTEAERSGGGRIVIDAGDLIDLHDGRIASSVTGDQTTTAGDITIDPRFIVLDGSSILARAEEGRGGNIMITVDNLIASPDSMINASAARGIDGTVVVSAPEVDLSGGLVVVEGAFADTAELRERCAARRDVEASSFTGVGRAGLPPSPDAPLAGAYRGADVALVGPAAGAFESTSLADSTGWPAGFVQPCVSRP